MLYNAYLSQNALHVFINMRITISVTGMKRWVRQNNLFWH